MIRLSKPSITHRFNNTPVIKDDNIKCKLIKKQLPLKLTIWLHTITILSASTAKEYKLQRMKKSHLCCHLSDFISCSRCTLWRYRAISQQMVALHHCPLQQAYIHGMCYHFWLRLKHHSYILFVCRVG